jgi:hypothetical protein
MGSTIPSQERSGPPIDQDEESSEEEPQSSRRKGRLGDGGVLVAQQSEDQWEEFVGGDVTRDCGSERVGDHLVEGQGRFPNNRIEWVRVARVSCAAGYPTRREEAHEWKQERDEEVGRGNTEACFNIEQMEEFTALGEEQDREGRSARQDEMASREGVTRWLQLSRGERQPVREGRQRWQRGRLDTPQRLTTNSAQKS